MYLILDVIWILESSIAALLSAINLTVSLRNYFVFVARGTNGTQRLNELCYLWAELPGFFFLISALLFGVDAMVTPGAGKSTKLFFLGVLVLYLVPPLIAAKSIFFIQHRDVFTRNAKRVDTGKHHFPRELLATKERINALGVWPYTKSLPLDLHADFQQVLAGISGFELNILMGYDVTRRELLNESMRRNVDLIHFASHSNQDGFLLSDGLIDAVALSSVIQASGAKIVILSACDTEHMINAILSIENVRSIVYTRTSVSDKDAIAFARPFYNALGRGFTIRRAFSLGKAMLPVEVGKNTFRLSGDEAFRFKIKTHNT